MSSIPLFSLYAKLSLEGANEFQRGLSAIETYAGRAAAAVRGLTSATTNMLGALGGGVAFGETLGFFGRLEASQKRLEAVLTATGNAAGFSGRQLLDYARKAADVGPFTRQSVVQAEAALARFGEIRGDTYMKALEKAKSLAALTGQDLPQAAETLGYALSDPTGRGLSRLQRLARLPVLPSEHRRIEALSVNPQTRP